jgi:uncharacterized membrane protein YdbT with pleckstrin-like domain
MGAPQPAAREETLWEGGPSPTLLMGHIAGIVVTAIALPLATRFFASTMSDDLKAAGMIRFGIWLTAILVTVEVIMLLAAWIRLRSTMYRVTNQRVVVEQGVFAKAVDEIDLRYVDDSAFTQTLVDRILGIGSVTLISSDKTSPRYLLRSIKDPRGVREIIRAKAYETSQRQIFTRAT